MAASPLHPPSPLARVRLEDVVPHDGAAAPAYAHAVGALDASLALRGAAVLELPAADAAVVRCALESTRAFFRGRPAAYLYRAGRTLEDGELSPACMADAFRCLGKAARAALSAMARHLRLRTDVFNHLLDDAPLPVNEVSSSELLVAYSHEQLQSGQTLMGCLRSSMPVVDRGFVTLVASDHPGIEVCDPNGHWYLADGGSGPSDLLLLTGRALSHVTAGLRPISQYRATNENRASLTFRLMPHANAILDCSPILASGHCIRQIYQPVPASQFMDDSCAEVHVVSSHLEKPLESQGNFVSDPSLRSVLSDPLSGAFLEDAMVLQCGHSFGGLMLKKAIEMARCTICNREVDSTSLFPNFALRAVATVVKMEDDRRLFHNAALRKRRKDVTEHVDVPRRTGSSSRDDVEHVLDAESPAAVKGVQYPFAVGERVLIMGNKRTPEKFVGKEAVITLQCLNGWYLVKALDSGESMRLQYRSLRKTLDPQTQAMVSLRG
ncbi:hypothetical protein ACQ4PT_047598 [Festuca glaucescens]